MITLRLRVWGLVQGVGFRFYTKRLADQLQINGMVKNKIIENEPIYKGFSIYY